MADIYSASKRSDIMSKILSNETKPEILVRKYLFSEGFRYRKNVKGLPGKPDIVLVKYKTVIFVNGCFWHGHNCKAAKLPKSNTEFWSEKIQTNVERDRRNKREIKKLGFKVITVWQCKLKNNKVKEKTFESLVLKIRNNFI